MTLSTPVKVLALAGVALILASAGGLMLASRSSSSPTPVVVQHPAPTKVVHVASPVKPKPAVHVHHRTPLALDPDLPAPVARKLHLSRETVAFVYTGASASDRALLVQVRAGAHAAGVPFVALNVTDEKTAVAVRGWTSSSEDPVVLVVERPGKIVFQLEGPTDTQTVAQAAAR